MKYPAKAHALTLLTLLIFPPMASHAENGCPPGMTPSSGTSMWSCTPIPYQNNQSADHYQSPTPQWMERWGAIAADEKSEVFGTSEKSTNQAIAEYMAIRDCKQKGGADCKIHTWYKNLCIAMVASDKERIIKTGASNRKARKNAMKACTTLHGDCTSLYSDCSLPLRIQ